MKLLLRKKYDYYVILNEDARYIVAHVYPYGGQQDQYYEVSSWLGTVPAGRTIAIVRSLDAAIPAFVDYYEKNPIRWEFESLRLYWRHTMSVSLRVEQDQQGYWLAYRDDYLYFAMESRRATSC